MFNAEKIKKDFPIFKKKINKKALIFLNNSSTTQKPNSVISSIKNYYENYNSNIGRSADSLSDKAFLAYENTRENVKKFINAKHKEEIIFTRNTTESLNLIAYTWGEKNIKENDEILVTIFEHHSNFIPWQELAKRKKAKFKIANLNKNLELDIEDFKKKLSKKTKIVAISATSNVLGLKENLLQISKIIKEKNKNCIFIVDGAQSIAHEKTDIQKINCDFFAFSGHKMLGPTGVGVLYGKKELLEAMPPFITGGGMIEDVTTKTTEYTKIPEKFEAGTPNIAGVIALNEAIIYLEKIGMNNIKKHENELFKYAYSLFSKHKEIKIYCPKSTKKRSGILSFTLKKIHPHDISEIFNSEGIVIRSGMHCTHPLHHFLKIPATARISFYIYNTKEDIDKAYKSLLKTLKIFS